VIESDLWRRVAPEDLGGVRAEASPAASSPSTSPSTSQSESA